MLIGAHVSPAGGLPKAIERGVQRGCRAIQIFNQSPRMWRPTTYGEEDVAAFREAMAASPIDAVLIHAVYLLNCASDDRAIREKSLASLTHSLRVGHAIGASAVVLHPGSAKKGDLGEALARAGQTIREALADSEVCELHLENTAGAGGTLGRSFDELARCWRGPARTGGWACALTPVTCSPRAMTSAQPPGWRARCARPRASSAEGASARCT
jgi:deoxyribonuclease-4